MLLVVMPASCALGLHSRAFLSADGASTTLEQFERHLVRRGRSSSPANQSADGEVLLVLTPRGRRSGHLRRRLMRALATSYSRAADCLSVELES